MTEAERREFAREQDARATVFVDADPAGDPKLDYYYPHARSPLCLHATLAASTVFFERFSHAGSLRFVTRMHGQVLDVERIDDNIFVGVTAQQCPGFVVEAREAAQLLCTDRVHLTGTPCFGSVGSPKLLVEMAEPSQLAALNPNLAEIAKWSLTHGVSGIYAYCRLGDDIYAGRNFNHLDPRYEDAATGVAAGALALSLGSSITVMQGDAIDQPCTVLARYNNGAVQVGGRVCRSTA